MELLAATFTISQGKTAAIFSTGDLSDLINSVETSESDAKPQPDIVKTMIETSPNDKLILDYGTRVGMENVFLYDVLGANMDEEDKADFIKTAINAIPVDLTIVELTGDITSRLNQEVLKEVDCSLFLIPTCWKAVNTFADTINNLPVCPGRYNMKYISAIIDPRSIGDKKFVSMIGGKIEDVIRFPENDLIPKEALAAHLDAIAQKIVVGDPQYVDLRQSMYEMMSYIFDSLDYKVIRPIAKWYR